MSLNRHLPIAICQLVIAAIISGWATLSGGLFAADAPPVRQHIRIVRDEKKQPVSLQTAVVRYSNASVAASATVDLVGAIHVGEKSYYDELNQLFDSYDAVLYELVAEEKSAVPTPGKRSAHPVGMMQVAMKNALGLEFQLDGVNYQRNQFIHADLSPDEFSKSMEQRGESFTKMLFRMMGQGVAQQSTDPARTNDMALLSALFSPTRSQDLKRVMAQQFTDMEKANAVLDGPDGSTIITERNRRAIQVLEKQIQAGKKRLAIFYGAAHMPDFDKRLRSQFGLEPAAEPRWLVAWDLSSGQASPSSPLRPSPTGN